MVLQDYDSVLTALLVSQALERDSLLVRGIDVRNVNDQNVVLVLDLPEAVKNDRTKESKIVLAKDREFQWTWIEYKRGDEWNLIATKSISQMYDSVVMYLAQGVAREADRFLRTLSKFCKTLGLENPGEALLREVETAKRDSNALELISELVQTSQESHHYAFRLELLCEQAFDACVDADEYREHGDQQDSVFKPSSTEAQSPQSPRSPKQKGDTKPEAAPGAEGMKLMIYTLNGNDHYH